MHLNIAGLTDIGKTRDENQDSIDWFSDASGRFGYLVVADGMGGYTGGAVASRLAIEAIGAELKSLPLHPAFAMPTPDEGLLRQCMQRALESANQRILDAKLSEPRLAQMGTTVVAIVIWQQLAVIAHVGDSRAYLWQHYQLRQVTRDHSLIQEMVDAGTMSAEEAAHSNQRNVLTRALGIAAQFEPSMQSLPLSADMLLLICSDGLTGCLSDAGIAAELAQNLPLLESCYRMVQAANANGGKDNISVVLAEVLP